MGERKARSRTHRLYKHIHDRHSDSFYFSQTLERMMLHTRRETKRYFVLDKFPMGFPFPTVFYFAVNICSTASRRCTLQRPRFPRRRLCENHDSMHFSSERGIPLRWVIFSFIFYIFYLRNWTFERAARKNLLRCQKLLCQWMAWIMLWIHTKLNFHSWNHRRWCSASKTICFSMTSRERRRKCARDVCVGLEAEIRDLWGFHLLHRWGKVVFPSPRDEWEKQTLGMLMRFSNYFHSWPRRESLRITSGVLLLRNIFEILSKFPEKCRLH